MYVSEKVGVGVGVGTWRRRGRIDQRRETMRRISQWVRLSVPFLFALHCIHNKVEYKIWREVIRY